MYQDRILKGWNYTQAVGSYLIWVLGSKLGSPALFLSLHPLFMVLSLVMLGVYYLSILNEDKPSESLIWETGKRKMIV